MSDRDIDTSSENVLSEWGRAVGDEDEAEATASDEDAAAADDEDGSPAWGTAVAESDAAETSEAAEGSEGASSVGSVVEAAPEEDSEADSLGDAGSEPGPAEEMPESPEDDGAPFAVELSHEHAAGDLHIPDGYAVLEGEPDGGRRAVGLVVSRFNGDVTTRLLERALAELSDAGVRQDAITIMVVPGAFELPLAATALAKTRRFACIVALGCVIRGDTPHFDYVASEAASGLQLAALETGVPVSFGVLTLDRVEQADPRIEKGAEAVRGALEMADLFAHLRAAASR